MPEQLLKIRSLNKNGVAVVVVPGGERAEMDDLDTAVQKAEHNKRYVRNLVTDLSAKFENILARKKRDADGALWTGLFINFLFLFFFVGFFINSYKLNHLLHLCNIELCWFRELFFFISHSFWDKRSFTTKLIEDVCFYKNTGSALPYDIEKEVQIMRGYLSESKTENSSRIGDDFYH